MATAAPAGREPPVGDAPVLVVGSPDDRVVPPAALERAARRYGGAPLLFPGMGHDLMLDARWQEPIDAILDWLDKERAGADRPSRWPAVPGGRQPTGAVRPPGRGGRVSRRC